MRRHRWSHQALQELRTGFMRHGLRWVIDLGGGTIVDDDRAMTI
jgi:hypothetical protein